LVRDHRRHSTARDVDALSTPRRGTPRLDAIELAVLERVPDHRERVTLAACDLQPRHQTLRTTPAMAAGVTKRLWEMTDVVDMLKAWEGLSGHQSAGNRRSSASSQARKLLMASSICSPVRAFSSWWITRFRSARSRPSLCSFTYLTASSRVPILRRVSGGSGCRAWARLARGVRDVSRSRLASPPDAFKSG
jgi:hypothetical protein